MKKVIGVALALFLFFAFSNVAAFAASPWTQETTHAGKAGGKLGFGFKNLALGWTEIFSKPVSYNDQGKNIIEGIGVGLWNAVAYTVGGAVHVATFFIPVDLPLPNDGIQSKLLG